MIEQNLTVPLCIHKVCMPSADNSSSLISTGRTNHLNIQFLFDTFLQFYLNALTGYHLFSFFHTLGSDVFQDFQSIFRLTLQGPQCNGNGQTNHARTGNTYSHGIFQDVSTQTCSNRFRTLSQYFRSLGHAKSHSHRFRTTDGWDHLPLNECDDTLSFCLCNHTDYFL